eukprot:s7040_g3.t1
MLCRIRLPRPFRSDVIRSHSDRVDREEIKGLQADAVPKQDREEIKGLHAAAPKEDREEIKGVRADAVPKEVAETFLEERCDKVAETFLEERCDKVIVSIESHVLPIATCRTAKKCEMQPDREEIKGVHADAVPKEVAETFLEERCDKEREEIKGVHADAVPKEVAETFLEERCDKESRIIVQLGIGRRCQCHHSMALDLCRSLL